MKNKKGFTLIELLAVVVILGLIMVIATSAVSKSIKSSEEKAKYIAAKEITEIAAAYMETENKKPCVKIDELITNGYLQEDVTNPATGENGGNFGEQQVCKTETTLQQDYSAKDNMYRFDGYTYDIDGSIAGVFVLNDMIGNISEEEKELADVNEDGKININDYNQIMQNIDKSLPGDVNEDKTITQSDKTLITQYIDRNKDLSEEQKVLADINKDEIVDKTDVDYIDKLLKSAEENNQTELYQLGDVNMDGEITEEDVDLVLKAVAKKVTLTEEQKRLADVTGDGKISATDSLKILKMLK